MGRIYLARGGSGEVQSLRRRIAGHSRSRALPPVAGPRSRPRPRVLRLRRRLIPYISEDSQPALWVLVTIYRRLLERIAEKQYDVFTAKVALSTSEKLRILGKGFIKRLT